MSLQTDIDYSARVVREAEAAYPAYCVGVELIWGLVCVVLPTLVFAWSQP